MSFPNSTFVEPQVKINKSMNALLEFLKGEEFAKTAQDDLTGLIGKTGGATKIGGKVGRFANSPAIRKALRVVPGLSAALVGLDVADVLVGQDSLANRGMDAAAMGIGGTLGAVGGPLGIAAGAGLGKMVSDGTQFIIGGGKSAEQRKIEEAVKLLQQRGLV